jgi:glycosyltransferase involved in cell wall biosynthesis
MSVTIVTPTARRPEAVLKRLLDCVDGQTYKQWHHVVIVDDDTFDGYVSEEIMEDYAGFHRTFVTLGYRSNDSGNTPRQTCIERVDTDFIVFVDDDNVIFPNYLASFMAAFQRSPESSVALCRIIHLGPLPAHLCPPPKVLDGNPPIVQNVDTLQLCVRSAAMKAVTWLNAGYMADGHTIQRLASLYPFVLVHEILGVHM